MIKIVINITSKLKRKLEMFTNVSDSIIIRADCVLDTFPFLTLFKLKIKILFIEPFVLVP